MATIGMVSMSLFTAGLTTMTTFQPAPGTLLGELAWSALALLAVTSVISLEAGSS